MYGITYLMIVCMIVGLMLMFKNIEISRLGRLHL